MIQRIRHVQLRARQDGASSWIDWTLGRIITRACNGAFIVIWMLFFRWVPLIFGRWWRRLLLKLLFRNCGSQLNTSTGIYIEYPWRISVGDQVWIGRECQIEGMGGITLGNNVMIALQSVLQSAGHEFTTHNQVRTESIVKSPIVIGDNVWLGARSMIRYGVTIGENAVVGMGAVVVTDVHPGTKVGGVPARPLGSGETNEEGVGKGN